MVPPRAGAARALAVQDPWHRGAHGVRAVQAFTPLHRAAAQGPGPVPELRGGAAVNRLFVRVEMMVAATVIGVLVGVVVAAAWPQPGARPCVCADTDGATAAGESPLWGAP